MPSSRRSPHSLKPHCSKGLKQLVVAGLVHQRELTPQPHYTFKHALIQDMAYQSLLKSTRQQYHRQIA
jgi:predicted ATPase